MKFSRRLAFFVLVFCAAFTGARAADDDLTEQELKRGYRARTLLAKPLAGAAVDAAEQAAGLKLVRAHARFGGLRTLGFERADRVEDITAVVKRLQDTGLYEYVELDYVRLPLVVPNDTRYARDQWSLNNTGQGGGTPGADIRAEAAWEIQREAPDVVVAVMDTGVRLTHPDIAANLWRNPGEGTAANGVDNDNNGYVDDLHGINTVVARTASNAGDPTDDDGHGSHVAGIIGGVGHNGVGITGVAWRTQIMALRFIGARGGSLSGLIACLDYAIAKNAKVINGSYGGTMFSQSEFDAMRRVRDAGIIFVAAAGNDSSEITELPEYPAAYMLDNIVAVASTTRQDQLASYSTYGSGIVELAAPGSSILSLGGLSTDADYVSMSGTSMAAPHVTGAFALLRQRFPNESYRGLINRVLSSVDVLPALENRVLTNGRLNLQRALSTTDSRPFNDDFARRAVITGGFNTVRGSNQFATTETGEPNHGAATAGTLWWQWTVPESTGKVTLNTTGSAVDTVLAVYLVSGSGSLATLQRVAFNDDISPTNTASSLTFEPVAGATYAIAIGGKNNAEGLITYSLLTIPSHDAFSQARALSSASVVIEDNNTAATGEPGEPKPRDSQNRPIGADKTLWYRWVAPATRAYQVSVHGTIADPVTSVYTGTSLTTLSLVTYDDDSGPGLDSLVRLNATAGVTYYICVDTFSASGKFTLSIADAAWQFVTDDELSSHPAIGADGTAFLADAYGYIHAINAAGTRRWRYEMGGFVYAGGVAVGADGIVYTGDDLGYLYALDPATGVRKWRFLTGGIIWSAPAIGADGTIFVHSDDGYLYAVRADGTQRWRFAIPGDTYTAPTIAPDGTIYIGAGGDNALYALNPDGTQKWRVDLGSTIYASPSLGADGTIYLGNYDGRVFALRADGTERWRYDTRSSLSSSVVIDAAGVVYFGSYDKKLYALNGATGAKLWDYTTGGIIRSTTPALADDGTIFVGSDDGRIYAVQSNGTLRRTYATGGAILAAPVIAGGRLYVASADAKLYAFDIGANAAPSPWPMHRHNLRRNGRAAAIDGLPAFLAQPSVPAAVSAGSSLTLSASASVPGGGNVTYQWYFNDVAISGATAASYSLPLVQNSHAGAYRVVATGSGGAVVSQTVMLVVTASGNAGSRLINLSILTNIPTAGANFTLGYVVGGSGTSGAKPLVIRAAGPSLGALGVTGTLDDPRFELFAGTTASGGNDNWGGASDLVAAHTAVGAFPFTAASSRDAAALVNITSRDNSVRVSAAGSGTGTVIAEIYDATPSTAFTATTPRLINVSVNKSIPSGGTLTAGFVISGTGSKQVMIRAIGPTLAAFGVTGTLTDPRLELFQASGTSLATNDNWGTAANADQVAAAAAGVGAFALARDSRDAVLLATLPPGNYTAQLSGVGTSSGTALVEIYEVP